MKHYIFVDQGLDETNSITRWVQKHSPGTGVITEFIQRYKNDVFFVQENVRELIRSTEGL